MKNHLIENTYADLIDQTFVWPQEGFDVQDGELRFNNIPLMEIIKQYGTPLKISYLPRISEQIHKAKRYFGVAMAKTEYKGTYTYCYCTKSSPFSFVLEEILKADAHVETSSAYDIPLLRSLHEQGKLTKDHYIVCNGFKNEQYMQRIVDLIKDGFSNTIPVLDNKDEFSYYQKHLQQDTNIGIRIAAEEESTFEFYTSRLGIRYVDIVDFYEQEIKKNPHFKLKMLHFFINSGIRDNIHYWSELAKCLNIYYRLKQVCPELDTLNIGGGLPIKKSLNKEFDYAAMIEQIIEQIKTFCVQKNISEPNIFTEFGSYTVGESAANMYSIVGQKQQNDRELWYMIDGSFITSLPDTRGISEKFILLAVNNREKEYVRVNLGGMTCDGMDYYNLASPDHQLFLPKLNGEKQYIGFFHTGAYQESISGFGGIKHCLIPSPKHVLIDRDEKGDYTTKLFSKEQSYKSMMQMLGY